MSYRVHPSLCWDPVLAPEVPQPTSIAPLHLIEWCVLWLIQADPRLSERYHRARLRTLMALLDPSFAHTKRVGNALARVRDLAIAGAVRTRGFDGTRERPTHAAADIALWAALRSLGRHGMSREHLDELTEPFFRWMGATPNPAAQHGVPRNDV